MFKVKDNILIWGDSQYEIPAEFQGKQVADIYGTATAGLARQPGIFQGVRGSSATVTASTGNISGRLVGDAPERGSLVHLREQLEPITGKVFWLISSQQIENEINWLNVRFDDDSVLVLCPFTMDYGIK